MTSPSTTSQDTRTQLLDAFAAALASTGYPGISLTDVAREAGIKKPSLYHHFPGGKATLYEAVAARFTDDLGARLAAATDPGLSLEERLDAVAQVSASHAEATVSFEQRIHDALDHVPDEVRDRVSRAYVDAILTPVERLFAEAVDSGFLTGDPALLTHAFLNLTRASGDAAPALVRLVLDGARPRT